MGHSLRQNPRVIDYVHTRIHCGLIVWENNELSLNLTEGLTVDLIKW